MPKLIEHIDATARRLKRDVLMAAFIRDPWDSEAGSLGEEEIKASPIRNALISFLDKHGIGWCECADVDQCAIISYRGQIFIDILYNPTNEPYELVRTFFEYPDGSPRREDFQWYLVPLDLAMKNSHHDAPGFWEKWVGEFWS